MMKPGEKVASAVQYRDYVLIVGDRGSMIKGVHEHDTIQMTFHHLADLKSK